MYRRTEHSLEHYIGFGKYQMYHGFVLFNITCAVVVNMVFLTYANNIRPKTTCHLSSTSLEDYHNQLLFDDNQTTQSRTPTEKNQNLTQLLLAAATGEQTESVACRLIKLGLCENRTETIAFHSASQEFGLICDKRDINFHIMSVQMLGVLIGAPTFGQVSDLRGRKFSLTIAYFGMLFAGLANGLCQGWLDFMIMRLVVGFFVGGCGTVMYVYLVEFMKPQFRLTATLLLNWALGFVYLAVIAWATGYWRWLTWLANLIGFVGMFLLWFTEESPRWLIRVGHTERALDVLIRLSKWNGQPIDIEEATNLILKEFEKGVKSSSAKHHSFWHLCYTGKFTAYSMTLSVAWCTTAVISYGIVLSMGSLFGNPFVNMGIYGCARWGVCILSVIADQTIRRLGRKVFHTICLLIVGICFVGITVIKFLKEYGVISQELMDDGTFPRAQAIAIQIAAAFTAPIWAVIGLMTAELFPTPIRNLSHSSSSLAARVGGIIAPQLLLLEEYFRPGPYLVFASLAFIDMILFLCVIPETKGKPLPELMPERSWCCPKYSVPENQVTVQSQDEIIKPLIGPAIGSKNQASGLLTPNTPPPVPSSETSPSNLPPLPFVQQPQQHKPNNNYNKNNNNNSKPAAIRSRAGTSGTVRSESFAVYHFNPTSSLNDIDQ